MAKQTIPAADEDALALIVEDAAKALAQADGSAVFTAGHGHISAQRARAAYRRQARMVINVARPQIEAPLIARYRPDVEMLARIREWASMYPTLSLDLVAQLEETPGADLEMAVVGKIRYLLAGGTYQYVKPEEVSDRD